MKTHILKINEIGNYKKEILKNPCEKSLKTILNKTNSHLLYWWQSGTQKIEAFGSIEQSNQNECNIHKLPVNGLSEILEENSNTIDVYGNLYIIKYINNKIVDLSKEEYLEFYEITKICDFSDDSDDTSRYDEEIITETVTDLQQKYIYNNLNMLEDLDIDENVYT